MAMEGPVRLEGMTEEQFAEAKRVFEVTQEAAARELWEMCCLMATKEDRNMLGRTEFQMRDLLHRIGVLAMQAAVNERGKKGGTRVVALPAEGVGTEESSATTTRGSSGGGRKRS
jgi:hypothetical protein